MVCTISTVAVCPINSDNGQVLLIVGCAGSKPQASGQVMIKKQVAEPSGRKNGVMTHSWYSNPLDWPHIDRMILLAALIGMSPFLISGGIAWLYWVSPDLLNVPVALGYIALQAVYALLLIGLSWMAFYKRQHQDRWDAMEAIIVFSYPPAILVGAWLSGTSFTVGLLLLVLGVNVAAPLASAKRLKQAYLLSFPAFALILLLILSGHFRYAPLFAAIPVNADGTPKTFWLIFEFGVLIVTLGVLYIALLSVDRWSNREASFKLMSSEDSLTRLANRRTFLDRAEAEFQRALRKENRCLACILLDIDHFKQVNDQYGHPVGDEVLVEVARCLQTGARPYDEIGRYGGEEFILLLPDTSKADALLVAERIRALIEKLAVKVDGQVLGVTASLGLACYPSANVATLEHLIKAADDALYAAKNTGRNRVASV